MDRAWRPGAGRHGSLILRPTAHRQRRRIAIRADDLQRILVDVQMRNPNAGSPVATLFRRNGEENSSGFRIPWGRISSACSTTVARERSARKMAASSRLTTTRRTGAAPNPSARLDSRILGPAGRSAGMTGDEPTATTQ